MEIKPELTQPVLRLLEKTLPDSLTVLYLLRNGAATSLLTDDPENPSFVIATIPRGGTDSNNAAASCLESFAVGTDVEALARALPRGNLLHLVPGSYVDAILRAWPGTVDPRPDGYLVFHSSQLPYAFARSLKDWEITVPVLTDGARVRGLTAEDAELVNKYWVRGAGESTIGYVRTLLAEYGGAGVETATGELVSWVVRYENESVGMAYTLEQQRGKGYSKAAALELLRQQQNAGVETAYFCTHRHNKSMLAYAATENFVAAEGLRYLVTLA
eukprot:m51a1_g7695 hypothetical protein (273) ;mRNA; f:61058-62062